MTKYDDTDFLSRMFTKNPGKAGAEPLGLNKQDSSEVLHKSQSVKMIGDTGVSLTSSSGPTTTTTGGQASNLLQSQGAQNTSAAARMLARKNNMLNS